MVALLSMIFGFLSPFATEILGYFKDKKDKKHELDIMQKQSEVAEQLQKYEVQKAQMYSDTEITKSINEMSAIVTQKTGYKFIDMLTFSVRPVITYMFFGMYMLVKVSSFYLLVSGQDMPWLQINYAEAMLKIWDEDDRYFLGYIMGFWFGERNIRRSK